VLLLFFAIKLIKYSDNRGRANKGDLAAGLNAWVTELYVARFLGLPLLAVRGLMFLSTVILVGFGLLGSLVWSYIAPYPLISISFAVVALLGCICWALMAEYNSEFGAMHSKGTQEPLHGSWA
jgi:hypothetical protein